MQTLEVGQPTELDVQTPKKSRQKGIARPHLTPVEISLALQLRTQGRNTNQIAKALGRHHDTIGDALEAFGDTTALATAKIRSEAYALATRIVEQADVDQAIEVLSRPNVGVLQPAQNGTSGQGVSVMIGIAPPGIGIEAKPVGGTFAPAEMPVLEAKSESETGAND
jgi:hypothetical protein